MPLDPDRRAKLEYLQSMLHGLPLTAHSRSFELMLHLIDLVLMEATEISDRKRSANGGASVTGRTMTADLGIQSQPKVIGRSKPLLRTAFLRGCEIDSAITRRETHLPIIVDGPITKQ